LCFEIILTQYIGSSNAARRLHMREKNSPNFREKTKTATEMGCLEILAIMVLCLAGDGLKKFTKQ